MVLLEFWAPWPESCKLMNVVLEGISEEGTDIKVCSINAEENPILSNSFRIKNLPTIVLMADGSAVHCTIGLQPKSTLISMISKIERN